MLKKPNQTTRELAVFTPLGAGLVLRQLDGIEAMSRLFQFNLEMLSSDSDIAATAIVGRNITFTLRTADGSPRYFNGFVSRFCYQSQDKYATTYRATIVPWLWFLTQTADCRIFQEKKTPEIIERVFLDLGFDDFRFELRETYQAREYCVQYRETDFQFVSRLMEEEGIFYFFEHDNGKHTLVLGDGISSYFLMPEDEVEFADPDSRGDLADQLTSWKHDFQYHSGSFAHRDFNFQTPRQQLETVANTKTKLPNIDAFQQFDYPGNYQEDGLGQQRSRVRIEAEETKFDNVQASGNYRSFAPGGRFRVKSHLSKAEVGNEYLVTSVRHSASVGGTYIAGTDQAEVRYENEFQCAPSSVVYRPQRKTPQPIVEGIQTAMIVGPPGEQIHTDEFGRVKVQFPWDREGSGDDKSSCWMRVSQIHAGHGWGNMDLPRIGEEVVVSFLEGDPDRPIIKGRVYNGRNRPPFSLPAEKTRSDGKTDTYMGSGYNEMSSDDSAGAEQIRINAQHDMDTSVNNNQTSTVGVDRSEDIGNNETLKIGVDASEDVGNNKSTAVGVNQNIDAANNIEITAGTSITLSVGASTIHMNQAGVITISGQFITSAAMATNSTIAPMTEIVGARMLSQAGLICMDLAGIKHIKGGETSISGAMVEVEGSEIVVVKGAPIAIGQAGAPLAQIPVPTTVPGGGAPDAPDAPAAPGSSGGSGGGATPAPAQPDKQESENLEQQSQEPVSEPEPSSTLETNDTPSPDAPITAGPKPVPAPVSPSGPLEEEGREQSTNAPSTSPSVSDKVANSENVEAPSGALSGKDVDAIASAGDASSEKLLKDSQTAHQEGLDAARAEQGKVEADAKDARVKADSKQADVEAKTTEIKAAAHNEDVKAGMRASAEKAELEMQKGRLENKASELEGRAGKLAEIGDDLESKAPTQSKISKSLTLADKALKAKTAVEKGIEAGSSLSKGDTKGAIVSGGEGMGNIIGGDLGAKGGAIAGGWLGAKSSLLCGPYAPACAVVLVPAGTVSGALYGAYKGAEYGESAGAYLAEKGADLVLPSNPAPTVKPPTVPPVSIPPFPDECFDASVLVHTDFGAVPISEIRVGQRVLARTSLGANVFSLVLKTSESPAGSIFAITVDDQTILATTNHHWHTAKDGWKATRDLQVGDVLTTSDDRKAVVTRASELIENRMVFNLEVEQHHNYFVGSGVLVHNSVRHHGIILKH